MKNPKCSCGKTLFKKIWRHRIYPDTDLTHRYLFACFECYYKNRIDNKLKKVDNI